LNTPQTLLYDKSRHVFGLSQAKEAIRKADYAVAVEGNLDVVSSHQAGVKQVVASAGTAMTEYHLRTLSRLSEHVRLAFDGDKAGLAATERVIPIAQRVGVNLLIVTLSDGAKDPDELIQKDSSLWQKAIDSSQPVVDWVMAQFAAREDLQTAAGKRSFTTAALRVIRALTDPVEQDHYQSMVARLTDSSREAVAKKLAVLEEPQQRQRAIKSSPHTENIQPRLADKNQDTILAMAMIDTRVQELLRDIDPGAVGGEERQEVVRYLQKHRGKEVHEIPSSLQPYEKYVTMLLLHPEMDNVAWHSDNRVVSATEKLHSLQVNFKKAKIKEQEAAARERGDNDAADEYLRQLNQLIRGEK